MSTPFDPRWIQRTGQRAVAAVTAYAHDLIPTYHRLVVEVAEDAEGSPLLRTGVSYALVGRTAARASHVHATSGPALADRFLKAITALAADASGPAPYSAAALEAAVHLFEAASAGDVTTSQAIVADAVGDRTSADVAADRLHAQVALTHAVLVDLEVAGAGSVAAFLRDWGLEEAGYAAG